MTWYNDDPRERINKRASIVILRPSMGHYDNPGTAEVDTKYGWYIHTSYKDYPSIDDWDPLWVWTFAPKMPT